MPSGESRRERLRRQARDRLNRLSQEAQVATVHDGEGEAVPSSAMAGRKPPSEQQVAMLQSAIDHGRRGQVQAFGIAKLSQI
eukprot:COSAG01_NODE_19948_length_980_cov_1.282633_1_plen_81_part_10